jgi:outer membrane lipoprotein SlyB
MNALIILILVPAIVVAVSHLFISQRGYEDDSAKFFTDLGICMPVAYAMSLALAVSYGKLSVNAGTGLFVLSAVVSAGLYFYKEGFPRFSVVATGVLACLSIFVSTAYAQSVQVGTVVQVSSTTVTSQTGENNGSYTGAAIGGVLGAALPKTSTGKAIGSIGGAVIGKVIGGIAGNNIAQLAGQDVIYKVGGQLFSVTQPGVDLIEGDSVYVTMKEGKTVLVKNAKPTSTPVPSRKPEPTGVF